jgi:hypothetical protein
MEGERVLVGRLGDDSAVAGSATGEALGAESNDRPWSIGGRWGDRPWSSCGRGGGVSADWGCNIPGWGGNGISRWLGVIGSGDTLNGAVLRIGDTVNGVVVRIGDPNSIGLLGVLENEGWSMNFTLNGLSFSFCRFLSSLAYAAARSFFRSMAFIFALMTSSVSPLSACFARNIHQAAAEESHALLVTEWVIWPILNPISDNWFNKYFSEGVVNGSARVSFNFNI